MAKKKLGVEVSLVRMKMSGVPEKSLLRSRNIGQIDLVWPRCGIARKSAAREIVFKRGIADFTSEEWTKRTVLREEIEDHCGLAVSITEPVSVQKIRRFLKLTAKYALKMGAGFMEKAMVGYADIASSPIDAIAAMIGEKDVPAVTASGVADIGQIPDAGGEIEVTVPLKRPSTGRTVGEAVILLRG